MLRRTRHQERGAALVEFALILPLLMLVLLGIITGGIAYNQKISITNATRESSRYAATLPRGSTNAELKDWFHRVLIATRESASGALDENVAGRRICVAFIDATASPAVATHAAVTATIPSNPNSVNIDSGRCRKANGSTFDDNITVGQSRVNVVASRSGKLEAMIFSRPLTLESTSVTRYEGGT